MSRRPSTGFAAREILVVLALVAGILTVVTYTGYRKVRQLVGATNYVKAVNTVAGESYPLRYTRGTIMTVTGAAGTRTVTYAP